MNPNSFSWDGTSPTQVKWTKKGRGLFPQSRIVFSVVIVISVGNEC